MLIIIDSREQNPFSFRDIETTVGKLDTGDYTLAGRENEVCIERKASVSELAKNITEDRFWREMDRMAGFRWKFILCEFSMHSIMQYPVGSDIPKSRWKYIRVRPQFILAKIAELEVDYSIPVILAGSREHAKSTLLAILKRLNIDDK
jgi:ERCC4-type nuclease